jgi:N-methylhydantoinase A
MRARYVGQGHELDVPFAPDTPPASMNHAFASRHHERYGFTLDRPVEIVSARCIASTGMHDVRLARRGLCEWGPDRRDDGGALDVAVRGRSTIALPDATLLVAEGWRAQSLPTGGWVMERAP